MSQEFDQLTKHMSLSGAFMAFSAGAFIGLGYALITEETFDLKSEKVQSRFCMRSLGGGVLTLGLYVWSPAWLRGSWGAHPRRV